MSMDIEAMLQSILAGNDPFQDGSIPQDKLDPSLGMFGYDSKAVSEQNDAVYMLFEAVVGFVETMKGNDGVTPESAMRHLPTFVILALNAGVPADTVWAFADSILEHVGYGSLTVSLRELVNANRA